MIQGKGVSPGIPVEFSSDKLAVCEDTQMQEALRLAKQM